MQDVAVLTVIAMLCLLWVMIGVLILTTTGERDRMPTFTQFLFLLLWPVLVVLLFLYASFHNWLKRTR